MAEANVIPNQTNLSVTEDNTFCSFTNSISDLKNDVVTNFTRFHKLLDERQALILSQS